MKRCACVYIYVDRRPCMFGVKSSWISKAKAGTDPASRAPGRGLDLHTSSEPMKHGNSGYTRGTIPLGWWRGNWGRITKHLKLSSFPSLLFFIFLKSFLFPPFLTLLLQPKVHGTMFAFAWVTSIASNKLFPDPFLPLLNLIYMPQILLFPCLELIQWVPYPYYEDSALKRGP